MPDAIDELQRRGLIALSTDESALRAHLKRDRPVTYYCGFDPTAPSLHVGHLLQFMVLRALQRDGHQPIVLVGGATGLIGDPRPSSERQLNDKVTVADWVSRIRDQVAPFLEDPADRDPKLKRPRYVNNLTWTERLSAIDFLRDLGKHFRVNRMLAKEAVSARLNSDAGISYTEFSYQILQANDFLELNRQGCTLQSGGSDQWGNITAGIDLIRRVSGKTAHALATPLIAKADGTKIGKTEGATIWLDRNLTSPYAFYQYWLNLPDEDARAWLPLFLERPSHEVESLLKESKEQPASRAPQRALAEDLTRLVHGQEELEYAQQASRALFGRADLRSLAPATLAAALYEAGYRTLEGPTVTIGRLLQETGLVRSLSDARRTVQEGGAYLNNERVTDAEAVPGEDDWLPGGWLVLRRGRRNVAGVHRGTGF